ncbi:MAG: glutamate--tRNA ligase, partial [Planctomycetes bacterium]|nr:glutamate--tRNA ligase [Planctomycetota bacterium]
GYLHVGGARTALFNYLLARQTAGTFILRIEDTDTARNVPGAERKIMDDLRWLGLGWDEGIGVGGPHGPYVQSQRLELYDAAIDKLLTAGQAYYAFETADELEAMRKEAESRKQAFRYPRPARLPDEADIRRVREEGRPVVVRFRTPTEDITVHDEVAGDVTVAASELDDFVIRKADGMPVYHLANVVDDHLMGVNLVMRGQEFLGQTPRHIALQRALGFATPRYAHLPLIMDMQGRKLSKRDGDVEVHSFRAAGYLPEALANFLALLGWSPGGDREKMTLAEMVDLFSIERIGRTNAKFDREKLLAFNTDAAAAAGEERLAAAFDDYLAASESPIGQAGLNAEAKRDLLRVNRGFRTFADIDHKCGFLYVADEAVRYDETAVKKVLDKGGYDMLRTLLPLLEAQEPWTAEGLEKLLSEVCGAHSVGMGKVAQPIRVAVSGGTISPAIYETLVLLGKPRTLSRIRRALALPK